MAPIYIFRDMDDDPSMRGGIGSEAEYERRYGGDEEYDAEGYAQYEYDEEWNRFDRDIETLSVGSPEEVRKLIGRCDTPEEVANMMYGWKEYPHTRYSAYDSIPNEIDTEGFSGSAKQFHMVMNEMRRRGEQTGDGAWGYRASDLEKEDCFEDFLADSEPDTTAEKEDGTAKSLIGGFMNTASRFVELGRQKAADMSKTGDIQVSGYTRVVNGKTVHVKGYTRKR